MRHSWSDVFIVLRRFNVGEKDRLIRVFSKRHGKLTVRARGVRDARSKRGAHVELFNTLKGQVFEGRGIPILGETELVVDRSGLKKELKLLRIAYYLAELVDRLTHEHDVNGSVFHLFDRALSSVSLDKWNNEGRLSQAFAEKVLTLTGFGVPKGSGDLYLYIEELVESRLRSQEILKD